MLYSARAPKPPAITKFKQEKMENLELENKEEKVVKATKKAKDFVSNETIQLIQDILDDGSVDLKWREALKAQVKKYKKDAE